MATQKCPHCEKPLKYEDAINDHDICPHCQGKIVAEKTIYPRPKPWRWAKRR